MNKNQEVRERANEIAAKLLFNSTNGYFNGNEYRWQLTFIGESYRFCVDNYEEIHRVFNDLNKYIRDNFVECFTENICNFTDDKEKAECTFTMVKKVNDDDKNIRKAYEYIREFIIKNKAA